MFPTSSGCHRRQSDLSLLQLESPGIDRGFSFSGGLAIAKSMQKIGLKTPWTGTWALIAPNFLKLGGKELIGWR